MKKVCTILTIICALFVGSAVANAQNLVGEWNATKAIVADEYGNKASVSMSSVQASMKIVFQENNQIVLSFDGESQQGNYLLKDGMLHIELDGETVVFPVVFTDAHTFEMDWSQLLEENIIFVLEKANAPVTSQHAEEYTGPINLLGSWHATEARVEVDGSLVTMDINLLELTLGVIFLENNQVILTANGEAESGVYQFDGNRLTITDASGETEICPVKFINADKFELDLTELGVPGVFIFERK